MKIYIQRIELQKNMQYKLLQSLPPSNCECDKSCDVGEHLAYKKCKFKKILIDIN